MWQRSNEAGHIGVLPVIWMAQRHWEKNQNLSRVKDQDEYAWQGQLITIPPSSLSFYLYTYPHISSVCISSGRGILVPIPEWECRRVSWECTWISASVSCGLSVFICGALQFVRQTSPSLIDLKKAVYFPVCSDVLSLSGQGVHSQNTSQVRLQIRKLHFNFLLICKYIGNQSFVVMTCKYYFSVVTWLCLCFFLIFDYCHAIIFLWGLRTVLGTKKTMKDMTIFLFFWIIIYWRKKHRFWTRSIGCCQRSGLQVWI